MTFWDFLYGMFVLILGSILFISWLGVKYDIIGRDKRNEELKIELEKIKQQEERRKKRKAKSKKRSV